MALLINADLAGQDTLSFFPFPTVVTRSRTLAKVDLTDGEAESAVLPRHLRCQEMINPLNSSYYLGRRTLD
jgi:hypothetical protein